MRRQTSDTRGQTGDSGRCQHLCCSMHKWTHISCCTLRTFCGSGCCRRLMPVLRSCRCRCQQMAPRCASVQNRNHIEFMLISVTVQDCLCPHQHALGIRRAAFRCLMGACPTHVRLVLGSNSKAASARSRCCVAALLVVHLVPQTWSQQSHQARMRVHSSRMVGVQGAVGMCLERSRQICLQRYEKPLFHDASYLTLYNAMATPLSRQQLAAFAAIFAWRDSRARVLDDAPHYIMSKGLLMSLAKAMPTNVGAARRITGKRYLDAHDQAEQVSLHVLHWHGTYSLRAQLLSHLTCCATRHPVVPGFPLLL